MAKTKTRMRQTKRTAPPPAARSEAVAMAIGAHPDDIEFHMAGTLLLLRERGFAIHYFNVASGNCGSSREDASTLRRLRAEEARASAKLLGAAFHPGLADDLEIHYCPELLKAIAAVIRRVRPAILLTHSPSDYMEDHATTCRLVVTAAFCRGMPNFLTSPEMPAADFNTTIYHAMPHGLRDPLRRRVAPGAFVNTAAVLAAKRAALARHKSQQRWLDTSQGMNSYLQAMEEMSLELGRMSGVFEHAEGWRRHLHLGFSRKDEDPLAAALGADYLVNQAYEKDLETVPA